MKKIQLTAALLVLIGLGFGSCKKKCQTCTTKVSQTVMGIPQKTSTSQQYCEDEYDDAPAEVTYTQNVGGISQEVEITCQDD